MFDLNTPEGRLQAIEALGPNQYNVAMRARFAANRIKVVNGHALRRRACSAPPFAFSPAL
jgi:hypothetical protein